MLLQFVEDQLISRRFSRWTSPFAHLFRHVRRPAPLEPRLGCRLSESPREALRRGSAAVQRGDEGPGARGAHLGPSHGRRALDGGAIHRRGAATEPETAARRQPLGAFRSLSCEARAVQRAVGRCHGGSS